MSVAAVILNYNDAENALSTAQRLQGFSNIDQVILIDNGSTDKSREVLSGFSGTVLWNEKNGGYGYGNNRGVREASRLSCDLTLICNPDTEFSEETVDILKTAFLDPETAAAGGLMEGKKKTDCAWPLLSLSGEVRFSGPILKRIFRNDVLYPESFFRTLPKPVGAVHGSLFMVRTADFLSAGGFDEQVFLFCEEKILGHRLRAIGKQVVLTGATYSHKGSETMKRSGMDLLRRQKERQKSERIFYRNYLQAGPLRMIPVKAVQAAVLFETRLLSLFVK